MPDADVLDTREGLCAIQVISIRRVTEPLFCTDL